MSVWRQNRTTRPTCYQTENYRQALFAEEAASSQVCNVLWPLSTLEADSRSRIDIKTSTGSVILTGTCFPEGVLRSWHSLEKQNKTCLQYNKDLHCICQQINTGVHTALQITFWQHHMTCQSNNTAVRKQQSWEITRIKVEYHELRFQSFLGMFPKICSHFPAGSWYVQCVLVS